MAAKRPPHADLFKIRTVTYFLPQQPTLEAWEAEIERAAEFLAHAQLLLEHAGECGLHPSRMAHGPCPPACSSKRCLHSPPTSPIPLAGYTVQTTRIATSALDGVTTPDAALQLAKSLEDLALKCGITFLSLGPTCHPAFLQEQAVPQLTAALSNTSFSVAWQRAWGLPEARLLASSIYGSAALSLGNFRFCVGFNCQPEIPYFPVAGAGKGYGFAIATENSALLHAAFSQAAADSKSAPSSGASVLTHAQDRLQQILTEALQPVELLAQLAASVHGVPFLGIDTSIAPALERPNIVEAFEMLGLGRFGGAGTLAVAERITAALKSVSVKLCGYCGLMLPVCEDTGLAAAAASGAITLQSLLHYSAVCGVGLDTVPVPGPGPRTDATEHEQLVARCAALLLDVAAMVSEVT